jgi:asparagine synthase (glutamine-hydrolysing)
VSAFAEDRPVFLFHRDDGARSARLADLVEGAESARWPLEADALAARLLFQSPTRPGATHYRGIVAERQDPFAAQRPVHVGVPRTVEDAAVRLRDALELAVSRAFENVRSVAVLAGGGVDSSALLALALREGKRRGVRVFAVALDFASYGDDRPYLRALEAHTGVEVFRVAPEEGAPFAARLDEGIDASPFVWPLGLAEVATVRRARDEGADVALCGAGGDELFDGHPTSLAERLWAGDVRSTLADARVLRGFVAPRSRRATWLLRPSLARIQPRWLRERRAARHPVACPSWAGPVLRREAEANTARALARDLSNMNGFEAFVSAPHQEFVAWFRHQEQIAAGLTRRDPYHDRDLVALVTALPPHFLLAGAARRGLFRRAVADLLPRAILERQDKAWFGPAFMRQFVAFGGLARVVDTLRDMRFTAELGLVEPTRFAAEAVETFRTRDEDSGAHELVWAALATEMFLRRRAGSA